MRSPLFAQFDNDEFGGKFYRLGDEVNVEKLDEQTLEVLTGLGRLSTVKPQGAGGTVPTVETPVEDMSRTELEAAAVSTFSAQLAHMSSDELRDGIQRFRDAIAERARGDDGSIPGGTNGDDMGEYAALKDKPLDSLKTAELAIVAKAEGVDVSGATTNSQRVGLIDEARIKARG